MASLFSYFGLCESYERRRRNALVVGTICLIVGLTFGGVLGGFIGFISGFDKGATLRQTETATDNIEGVVASLEVSKLTYNLSDKDIVIAALAMTKATRCDETLNCAGIWEWSGSSDYNQIPYVVTVHDDIGMETFVFVIAEEHRSGDASNINARLVVYHYTRDGGGVRIDELGNKNYRTSTGGWVHGSTVRDEEFRTRAVEILLDHIGGKNYPSAD